MNKWKIETQQKVVIIMLIIYSRNLVQLKDNNMISVIIPIKSIKNMMIICNKRNNMGNKLNNNLIWWKIRIILKIVKLIISKITILRKV